MTVTEPAGLEWDGLAPVLTGEGSRRVIGPLRVRTWDGVDETLHEGTYSRRTAGVLEGAVALPGGGTVSFRDLWTVEGDVVRLDREVEVTAGADGAFATEVALDCGPGALSDVGLFVPGTQYGDPARANPAAIGGADGRARGDNAFRIRADRMPAPVMSLRLVDGSTVAVLDVAPDGRTVVSDAEDTESVPIVDAGLRVGAFGLDTSSGRVELSYGFPGTEGPVTYRGDSFPDGQVRAWRRRYHPLVTGAVQRYSLGWRQGREDGMPALVTTSWRWAWQTLRPTVELQDIGRIRGELLDQLAGTVMEVDGRAGFPHFMSSTSGERYQPRHRQDTHALMGFTGRSTDCAYYLLREAERLEDGRADRYAALARKVLDSFTALPCDPPQGEGFDIETGEVVPAAPHQGRVDIMLLRGLAEGAKSMLRAWRHEQARGRDQERWLAWAAELTDWLLRQQRRDGSFPRSWRLGSEDVVDGSGYSTYNAVSLLVEAYRATGTTQYLTAAIAAGEHCWESGQREGVFVGGTVDNPDVIDKEAGTLSLEAYLALLDVTGDRRWLDRAVAAASFAETWIYLWDLPMPYAEDAGRGWKRGVTSVGAQLIASGHSLVDQYMAFDVGAYATLFTLTGDDHHLEVATLLLHNTKAMLATEGRVWDLAGPGWQQEHWSFAPVRGEGLHRGWLPWVTCSHLEGIIALEDHDPELFDRICAGNAS